ncbi:hypothetical protein IRJ41_000736, partial [Triplophysa rosa]
VGLRSGFCAGQSISTAVSSDPCSDYNTIDDCWRDSGLWLNGPHPQIEDGVVTREVCGGYYWGGNCCDFKSNPIRVKACPGNYYISTSDDPCYNYESLDRPWRATTESGLWICDESFSWSGWYRLYYYGMNIQMTETCVNGYSCNSGIGLWLNGPHPQIEDGVVTREVCGGDYWSESCCYYKSKPIRVKACPGNYYVYELVKPQDYWCIGYCTDVSTISQTDSITTTTLTPGSSITDDYWRSTLNYMYWYGYITGHDDTRVKWDGWYRLFINGSSAQMPDWCVSYMSCGGFSSLWLGGSHPGVEDGVVTREVYGSHYDQCSQYTSNPIQVKACPGHYYVYKLTRPNVAIPLPSYCAVPFSTPSVDPCDSYTSLDEPWRSTDNPYYNYYYNNYYTMCDYNVEWNGWYRLFINGQSTQMSESCVSQGMCGTYSPLYLRDPHPQLEDGVVTRHVCMSGWNGCCGYESHPIQVKACPGDYYVYEFVRPMECAAYCADVRNVTPTSTIDPTTVLPTVSSDPCTDYNTIDDYWRDIRQNPYQHTEHDDRLVEWNGWYRLYLNGESAQMSEWCVSYMGCGGYTGLYLNGSHPGLEDGVVTRDVVGSHIWYYDQCGSYRSNPVQVKACPGDYYVYELITPDVSLEGPSYCAVSFSSTSDDPCYNYESLDRPWRATNESGLWICDEYFSWSGWYRLYYYGMNIQMPETCVNGYSCNADSGLWLNGPHPQIEDGVVTREVCGGYYWGGGCCDFKSKPIRVKACPGNYFVYELVNPQYWCLGYCTDVSTISQTDPTTTPAGPNATFCKFQ